MNSSIGVRVTDSPPLRPAEKAGFFAVLVRVAGVIPRCITRGVIPTNWGDAAQARAA